MMLISKKCFHGNPKIFDMKTCTQKQLTIADSDSMEWKSNGSCRSPRVFAVMLTHSSLSSLAAAVKLCSKH